MAGPALNVPDATMSSSLVAKLAIAIAIAIVVVGTIMPRYARAWVRANIVDILRLLGAAALMGTAIHFARQADSPYIRIGGTLAAVAGFLSYLLIDRTLRTWVKFISIDQW